MAGRALRDILEMAGRALRDLLKMTEGPKKT